MTLDDTLLEKYGDFYCSEYVAKNQPWILELPFHEWVERHVNMRMKRLESLDASAGDHLLEPYGLGMTGLSETA